MATIAEMAVKIGVLDKDFNSSMDNIHAKTKALGDGVKDAGANMTKWVTGPIIAVGTGLVLLATKTGDYADRILDLEQITGMSSTAIQEWQGVAARAGVETEAVTDASKQLTKQMSAMEDGTGKQAEALSKLGIEYGDLEKATPDERMNMLTEALAGVEDPAKRAEYGTDLLKGSWETMAPIVSMGADAIDDAKRAASESGAVMGGEALNDANNFRVGMEELKEQFAGVTRTLATDLMPIMQDVLLPLIQDKLIPAVEGFVEKISLLVDWFKNLSPEGQNLALIITGIFVAIGPVLVAVGIAIKVFAILTTVAKVLGIVIGIMTSPIGLVVLAVVGLIAIGVLLYKNWDTVKAKAIEIWDKIKNYFSQTVDKIKQKFNDMKNAVSEKLDEAKAKASEIMNNIIDFFTGIDLYQIGKDIITGLINGIGSMVSAAANKIKEVAGGIKDAVTGFFGIKSPSRLMMGYGVDIGDGLVVGMDDAEDKIIKQSLSMASAAKPNIEEASGGGGGMVAMLERIESAVLNAKGAIYLDTGALVGGTYNAYDRKGGNVTSLSERWGR